jgi:Leucine-rich repeat (LRR) protein
LLIVVGCIGDLLPNLQQLTFVDSLVNSFRDLGRGLRSLQSLSMCRCGVRDLDGVEVLTSLRELHLQFNSISDLTSLAEHPNLCIVDLHW